MGSGMTCERDRLRRSLKNSLDSANELIEAAPRKCARLAARVGSAYTAVHQYVDNNAGCPIEDAEYLAYLSGKLAACNAIAKGQSLSGIGSGHRRKRRHR